MEYRFEIDRLHLEEEWAAHPMQVSAACDKVADMQLAYDTHKAAVETIEADLDNEVRTDLELAGTRVTEGKVSAALKARPEYKAAQRKVREARHALEKAKGRVNALEHRKRALTSLTDLWIRDYYNEQTPSRHVQAPPAGSMTEEEKEHVRKRAARRRQEDHSGE
jgi:hypothetical protein